MIPAAGAPAPCWQTAKARTLGIGGAATAASRTKGRPMSGNDDKRAYAALLVGAGLAVALVAALTAWAAQLR